MHKHGPPQFFSSSPRMYQLGSQTFQFLRDPAECPKVDRVSLKKICQLNQRLEQTFRIQHRDSIVSHSTNLSGIPLLWKALEQGYIRDKDEYSWHHYLLSPLNQKLWRFSSNKNNYNYMLDARQHAMSFLIFNFLSFQNNPMMQKRSPFFEKNTFTERQTR